MDTWDIFKRRLGNMYLVDNQIKGNLCSEKPVKPAFDVRNLADEASIIHKRSRLYAELDTQHMISTNINCLPSRLDGRMQQCL